MNTKITNKILTPVLVFLALILFGATIIKAAPGDLDLSFGNGGKVITDFDRIDYAFAATLQPDGKLIVAGSSFNTASPDFLIVRYNGDGSLDTSFGNGGKVVNDFGAQDYAHAVALQPDGKIVAAGLSQSSSIGNIVLARYNADGSLDSAFGSGGKVTTDINGQYERADALVLQADGKLVTAGFTCGGGNCDLLLIRYNSNGSLDSTFGSGGIVTTDLNGQGVDSARALVLQPDGKIVAAGSVYLSAKSDFALARYNSNGTLDTTFGAGGKVTTDFGDSEEAGDVVIQPDGKIVAAGSFGDGDPDNDPSKFSLARYNADGTLDATFGSGGKVLTDFGQSSPLIGLSGLALQADGKIVAAGTVRLFNENFTSVRENFALVRYNTNGTLDTTFGTGGIVTTGFGVFVSASGGIVIQPDGKIVAAGYTIHENNSSDIALARYLGGSAVARRTSFDFDGDGRSDISVFRPSDSVWYLNQSTNGFSATQFGLSTDKITPADFDGDGKTDIAVYRDGVWYWLNSSNGNFNAFQFGLADDIPVPADFTGDGRSELAVYRSGTWFTWNLANSQFNAMQFGIPSDKVVPADFDGDGTTDLAVYRDGIWFWLRSSDGQVGSVQFGIAEDKPTIGDYDGDGKADPAVYRSGIWYVLGSTQGFYTTQFGIATDIPTAADYDGDGETDIAVYRSGVWYWLRSSDNGFRAVQFGIAEDKPIPAAFVL